MWRCWGGIYPIVTICKVFGVAKTTTFMETSAAEPGSGGERKCTARATHRHAVARERLWLSLRHVPGYAGGNAA